MALKKLEEILYYGGMPQTSAAGLVRALKYWTDNIDEHLESEQEYAKIRELFNNRLKDIKYAFKYCQIERNYGEEVINGFYQKIGAEAKRFTHERKKAELRKSIPKEAEPVKKGWFSNLKEKASSVINKTVESVKESYFHRGISCDDISVLVYSFGPVTKKDGSTYNLNENPEIKMKALNEVIKRIGKSKINSESNFLLYKKGIRQNMLFDSIVNVRRTYNEALRNMRKRIGISDNMWVYEFHAAKADIKKRKMLDEYEKVAKEYEMNMNNLERAFGYSNKCTRENYLGRVAYNY